MDVPQNNVEGYAVSSLLTEDVVCVSTFYSNISYALQCSKHSSTVSDRLTVSCCRLA